MLVGREAHLGFIDAVVSGAKPAGTEVDDGSVLMETSAPIGAHKCQETHPEARDAMHAPIKGGPEKMFCEQLVTEALGHLQPAMKPTVPTEYL